MIGRSDFSGARGTIATAPPSASANAPNPSAFCAKRRWKRLGIGEAPDDVRDEPRRDIVVAVDWQRADEIHRADREDRAALRRFEEGQVGADDVLARRRPGVVEALLVDRLVGRVFDYRASHDDGMGRRAEADVGAVELVTRRTAAHQAALAEDAAGARAVRHALAHEG